MATGALAVAEDGGYLGKTGINPGGRSFWIVVFAVAVGKWKRRKAGTRT